MADEFDAIVDAAFREEVVIGVGDMRGLFESLLRLLDGAETVGAIEVWEAIDEACEWFHFARRDSMVDWVSRHVDAEADDEVYEWVTDAIQVGVPALETFMREHSLDRIHHWTATPWGFLESLWSFNRREVDDAAAS